MAAAGGGRVGTECGSVRQKKWTLKLPRWPRGWAGFGCWGCCTSSYCTPGKLIFTHTFFFFLSLCPNSAADEGIRRPLHCLTTLLPSTSLSKIPVSQPAAPGHSPIPTQDREETFAYRRSATRARSRLLILPELELHRAARHNGSHGHRNPPSQPRRAASRNYSLNLEHTSILPPRSCAQSEADRLGNSTTSRSFSAANTATRQSLT